MLQNIDHTTFGFGRVFHVLLHVFQSEEQGQNRVTVYTHFPSSLIITDKQLSFIPFLLINPIKQFLRISRRMTPVLSLLTSVVSWTPDLDKTSTPVRADCHVSSGGFLLTLNTQSAQEKPSGQSCCSYYSNSGIIQCLHFISL